MLVSVPACSWKSSLDVVNWMWQVSEGRAQCFPCSDLQRDVVGFQSLGSIVALDPSFREGSLESLVQFSVNFSFPAVRVDVSAHTWCLHYHSDSHLLGRLVLVLLPILWPDLVRLRPHWPMFAFLERPPSYSCHPR